MGDCRDDRSRRIKVLTGSLCISHSSDADGICSAALVKMVTGAEVRLADYGDLLQKLRDVSDLDQLYICDLGLSPAVEDRFIGELRRIGEFASITYIDHHPINSSTAERIRRLGVVFQHSTEECSSILVYDHFKRKLPREAALLALYGAVTDYLDSSPIASSLMDEFDRMLVLFESSVLSYAICEAGPDESLLMRLVKDLASLRYPHQIDGVLDLATKWAESLVQLMEEVGKHGVKTGSLAYVETTHHSTGSIANLVRCAFGTPVGAAYRFKEDGFVEISLRASKNYSKDLGEIVSAIALRLCGAGGGHKKASGARISSDRIRDFLDMLSLEVG